MRGHADIQKELQKKGIGIEMCPISNLQTKAVESTKDYPMREFLNAGLKVTVNTDNRTVSNTTLTKELEFIQKNYGITDEAVSYTHLSHGQFDRLYVLPVRDRDRPLHCRCFYLSGISLVQEMAGEKKRRKVQHG